MEKLDIATYALILASFVFTVSVGVGIYEAITVMPAWFAKPPASFALIKEHSQVANNFWIPIQIATLIMLLTALVLNWNMPQRKFVILLALGGYALVWILSAAYFIREIMAFSSMPTTGTVSVEIIARGHRWLTLSWIRHAILIVADMLLLAALTL